MHWADNGRGGINSDSKESVAASMVRTAAGARQKMFMNHTLFQVVHGELIRSFEQFFFVFNISLI